MEAQSIFLAALLGIAAVLHLQEHRPIVPPHLHELLSESLCTGVDLNIGCVPVAASASSPTP
jgi:hypothetical protein